MAGEAVNVRSTPVAVSCPEMGTGRPLTSILPSNESPTNEMHSGYVPGPTRVVCSGCPDSSIVPVAVEPARTHSKAPVMSGIAAAPTYLVGLGPDTGTLLHEIGALLAGTGALLPWTGALLFEPEALLLETGAATPERVLAR
jgi:hypothetical protein